jgi:glycosyltransferase involved in cell wall biosynthesis
MMRILHIISSIDPRHGGVTEGLRQLADVSMKLGCTVEAATLDAAGEPFLADFSFPIHALGPGITHFQYSKRLRDWLFAHVADYDILVVHALWQYHTVAVRQAALRHHVPYVVYTHGMLDPYFKRADPLKHAKKWLFWPWADYRVLRDANAVLFTTEEERLLARQSFWLYSANEIVVNLGTARPLGNPGLQRDAFYSLYPDLRGKKLALFLGRIHPKKGCDLAIKAFSSVLASADPDWMLVMAGPDQVGWRAELERLAQSLGIGDRILWTGMLQGEAKWGAIRSSEFFFLPSHQENFGVVVAEALACGIPALISDKINIWREVKEFGAGLVAPDTEIGATSLLRQWLSLGSAGQDRMRANAAPCFEAKFEIGKATENLLATLRAIAPEATLKTDYANV